MTALAFTLILTLILTVAFYRTTLGRLAKVTTSTQKRKPQ